MVTLSPAHYADLLRIAGLWVGPFRRVERGSREAMLALQAERLDRLLAHAAARSPFYQRRWGGRTPRAADLAGLEPTSKAEINEHYDDVLTDRSLSRATLSEWLHNARRHPYVVAATSGTTGRPLLVPYSRDAWRRSAAYMLRGMWRIVANPLTFAWHARRPATIVTRNPIHLSTQLRLAVSAHDLFQRHLAAGMPFDDLVAELQRFQPTVVSAYPSILDELLAAQEAGALRITPRVLGVAGETMPAGFRQRAADIWGAEVFEMYGLTEAHVCAGECHQHTGMHLDEDGVILEVVDEDGRAVPPGVQGASVLVTSLLNETLPIIRYRVDDMLCIDEAPCACGSSLARIVSVEGRQAEWLILRTTSGDTVKVRPSVVEAVLQEMPAVTRFQLRNGHGVCRVLVVAEGDPAAVSQRLRVDLVAALTTRDVPEDGIDVAVVDSIEDERGPTDKRRRVIRD